MGLGPILHVGTSWLKPLIGERVDLGVPDFLDAVRLKKQSLRQSAPERQAHSQQEVERGSGADRSDPQPESRYFQTVQ